MKIAWFGKRCLPLLAGVVAAFLCGCSTVEVYQAEAVDRARVYLVENARDLSPEEVSKIKFTDPILLFSGIFSQGTPLQMDLKQICIAWPVGNSGEFYLVYGASTGTMSDWRPIRAFRKKFRDVSYPLVAATEAAREYMLNFLYHDLSTAALNQVRFLYPTVIKTNFTLLADPDSKLTEKERQEKQKKLARETQYSLVWFPPEGQALVFCGTSREDLKGWKVNFAGFMDQQKLRKHTLAVVKRQDQDTSAFLSPEEIRQLEQREKEEAEARAAAAKGALQQEVQQTAPQEVRLDPKSTR